MAENFKRFIQKTKSYILLKPGNVTI